jgi:hypothetical protein
MRRSVDWHVRAVPAVLRLIAAIQARAASEEVRTIPTRKGVSSPSEAAALDKALAQATPKEILTFEGGNPPRSDACEAQAQHGYFGIEREVVDAIVAWIRAPYAG